MTIAQRVDAFFALLGVIPKTLTRDDGGPLTPPGHPGQTKGVADRPAPSSVQQAAADELVAAVRAVDPQRAHDAYGQCCVTGAVATNITLATESVPLSITDWWVKVWCRLVETAKLTGKYQPQSWEV